MGQGTEGKLATDAINGDDEKGFPSDLVKTTRAMLSALHAASFLEGLGFPQGTPLKQSKTIGTGDTRYGSLCNGACAL
jgi:proteic killer suppression protein